MKRLFFILLISSLFQFLVVETYAQRWKRTRYEVMYGIGNSFFMGDLGGSNRPVGKHNIMSFQDIDILSTRPIIFVATRYKIVERFAVKLNIVYGGISADDKNTQLDVRRLRGLSFTSSIFEPSLQTEFSLIKEREGRKYSIQNLKYFKFKYLNTYLIAGVGAVMFNPQGKKDGVEVPQGSYSKTALAIPVGIGLKYGINRKWSIGIELTNRYTTSDYLDNHSDIHSKANDSYFLMMYQFSYKLKTTRSGLPKF